MKCKNCEHYILSECNGFPEGTPLDLSGCYLENVYGLKAERMVGELADTYKEATAEYHNNPDFRKKADAITLDLYKNKTKSRYYPLWRMLAIVGTKHVLDMCHRLNVDMRLDHIRGESFYAGIPRITAEEIKFWW